MSRLEEMYDLLEARITRSFNRSDARDLIGEIDHFHGNELKDRSKSSVEKEINAVLAFLKSRHLL